MDGQTHKEGAGISQGCDPDFTGKGSGAAHWVIELLGPKLAKSGERTAEKAGLLGAY
jgi:hypothetical protein